LDEELLAHDLIEDLVGGVQRAIALRQEIVVEVETGLGDGLALAGAWLATGLGLGGGRAGEDAGAVMLGAGDGDWDGDAVGAGEAAGVGPADPPSTIRLLGLAPVLPDGEGLRLVAGLAVALGLAGGAVKPVRFNLANGSRKARMKTVRIRMNRTTTRKVIDMPVDPRPELPRGREGAGFLRGVLAIC